MTNRTWQRGGLSYTALMNLLDKDVSNDLHRSYTVSRDIHRVLVTLELAHKMREHGMTLLVCDSVPEGRFYVDDGSKESCGCPKGCQQSTV